MGLRFDRSHMKDQNQITIMGFEPMTIGITTRKGSDKSIVVLKMSLVFCAIQELTQVLIAHKKQCTATVALCQLMLYF